MFSHWTPRLNLVAILSLLWVWSDTALTQEASMPSPTQTSNSTGSQKKTEPAIVHNEVLERATPDNIAVVVTLSSQRAQLKVGDETAIDAPVSTGQRAGWTPKGSFVIVQKEINHRSTVYGNFVSTEGHTVRSGVNSRKDIPPSGAAFVGAPMKWFMRLGSHLQDYTTVGMHAGKLPGYPASHGCIRLPEQVARLIFEKAKIGTPVMIVD
ncbi:MAG: L,D-transpeptidase family protein [bacterium]